MEYDNTNKGAIWPNKKKATDKHPDFTGDLNVDGKEYWVSAWKKDPKSKAGSPSLRFSIKAKDGAQKKQEESDFAPDDLNDEIPF